MVEKDLSTIVNLVRSIDRADLTGENRRPFAFLESLLYFAFETDKLVPQAREKFPEKYQDLEPFFLIEDPLLVDDSKEETGEVDLEKVPIRFYTNPKYGRPQSQVGLVSIVGQYDRAGSSWEISLHNKLGTGTDLDLDVLPGIQSIALKSNGRITCDRDDIKGDELNEREKEGVVKIFGGIDIRIQLRRTELQSVLAMSA